MLRSSDIRLGGDRRALSDISSGRGRGKWDATSVRMGAALCLEEFAPAIKLGLTLRALGVRANAPPPTLYVRCSGLSELASRTAPAPARSPRRQPLSECWQGRPKQLSNNSTGSSLSVSCALPKEDLESLSAFKTSCTRARAGFLPQGCHQYTLAAGVCNVLMHS